MQAVFNYIANSRANVLEVIQDLTDEELNEIPPGFRNNIIWHIGHLIVSQYEFFYSHLPKEIRVDPQLQYNFRIGSAPNHIFSEPEIKTIKTLAVSSINQMKRDYSNEGFQQVGELDVILTHFIFHEGLHMAYILSIKKLLLIRHTV